MKRLPARACRAAMAAGAGCHSWPVSRPHLLSGAVSDAGRGWGVALVWGQIVRPGASWAGTVGRFLWSAAAKGLDVVVLSSVHAKDQHLRCWPSLGRRGGHIALKTCRGVYHPALPSTNPPRGPRTG